MSDLKNRVALVTGGSRGIGEAIAIALAKAGAAVAVNYRERSQEAAAVVENIQRNGGRAAAIAADVSLAGAVRGMISDVESRLGPIDILVNNAGIAVTRGLDEITEEDFDRTVAVNLKSAFLCTQGVLAGMRATLGADRQYFIHCCAGSRIHQRRLQRFQSRPGGLDTRLRLAPRSGRCYGQRRRTWSN